jgi:hypothetical protein
LAQSQSNRGRRGRKRDFPDAERLVKRLVAQELSSLVSDLLDACARRMLKALRAKPTGLLWPL